MSTTRTDVRTPDGTMSARVCRPEGEGPWPGVVLVMDAFGMRDAVVAMGERLASAGYVVVVPDPFYRAGDVGPFDPRTAFSDPAVRPRLLGLMRSIDGEPAVRDVEACLAWLETQPDVRRGPAGIVGYCMGGRIAFAAAAALGEKIGAAASIHGGRIGTDDPLTVVTRAADVKARLYAAVAAEDGSHTPEMNERLDRALREAGVRYEIEHYDAKHGFAVPDSTVFDARAAERHWEKVIGLFRDALG